MSKKTIRFFGGLLTAQENWLNRMAKQGYRLKRTKKLLYEFERCAPDRYQYCMEFIGHNTKAEADDYRRFLAEVGYRTITKNINLNWSIGKLRWRPWANQGGRIATNNTVLNRELLIVEKEKDGKPFELHTSYADQKTYYCHLRDPWLFILSMFAIFALINRSFLFGTLAFPALIPAVFYQAQIVKTDRAEKIKEW